MKIHVKGYLTLRQVMGEKSSLEMALEGGTLRSLLQELGEQLGEEFRQAIFEPETGQLLDHIAVMVNGRHYAHLPGGLDSELKDGDAIAIFPPVAGGSQAGCGVA